MSQSAIHHYPKGPALQGTLTTPPSSLHYPDHKSSPSTYSSPSSPVSASCSTTPITAMAASPVTVYSDRLFYQAPLAPTSAAATPPRRQPPVSSAAMPVEFVRAHAKGSVRFRPFEAGLDEAAVRAIVDDFQVYPFGDIEEYCRHIPYASGKKDFYEKTGRESFEVFQYVFKVPGDDDASKEYHVMWDYNVGLVRMTPFFKCCKYSKTTPAKMLGLNPGLREITHSITGGSIMAQGYWMPYACAKAVCATFCYRIAGALVPIFGPGFPAECVPPQSPDFGRMVIDNALVQEATRDTERMRQVTLKDTKSAGGKLLPFHQTRHQSLELDLVNIGRRDYDRYNHYDQYKRYGQYGYEQEQYGQYSRDAFLPQLPHLPHLAHYAHHAHNRSDTLHGYHHEQHQQCEKGPDLAPLRYFTSHRGSLLPSPIEHERLPPFSHIASLTSTERHPERHPERQQTDRGTTLPPLIVREGQPVFHNQPQAQLHHSARSAHNTSHPHPTESQVETLHPEPHCREDKRCFNATMEVDGGAAVAVESRGYEDYTRPQVDQVEARQANTNAHQTCQTKTQGRTDNHTGSFTGNFTGNYTEGRQTRWPAEAEAVDAQQHHRFAPSSCYPSPPRLPRLVPAPYERQAKFERLEKPEIVDNADRRGGHRKSMSMSSLLRPQRRRHPQYPQQQQQHYHHRRRQPRHRALKDETPLTAWNAKDADAAEMLVNLRDDGQEGQEYGEECAEYDGYDGYDDYDDYEERVQDSIQVSTSPQHPSLPLLQSHQTRTAAQPQHQPTSQPPTERFAACIASLLCDDAVPRKKRRGV